MTWVWDKGDFFSKILTNLCMTSQIWSCSTNSPKTVTSEKTENAKDTWNFEQFHRPFEKRNLDG